MSNDLRDQFDRARDVVSEKAAAVRDNTAMAIDASREAADVVKERGAKLIRENPLAVVAGGLAAGLLLGALLPKTARRGRAAAALAASLAAARGAGAAATGELAKAGGKLKEKIGEIDPGAATAKLTDLAQVDRAKEKISGLLDKASDVVSAASKSAAETLRRKQ